MKKLAIIMAVAAGSLAFNTANAQIGLHVNLHLGGVAAHVVLAQPAPVADYAAYDNSDDYYYLPDVEAYYNIPQHCYYYNDGERWVSAAYLPGRYHDYDWRAMRHYEVREARPFMHHDMYRERFGGVPQREAWNGNENRGFENRRGGEQRNYDSNKGWGGQDRGQYQNQNGYQRGNDQQGRDYGQYQNQNGYQRGNDQQQSRGNYGQNQNSYQRGNNQQQGRGNYGQNTNGWQGGQQGQQNRSGNYSQSSNNRGGNGHQKQSDEARSNNRFVQYNEMRRGF